MAISKIIGRCSSHLALVKKVSKAITTNSKSAGIRTKLKMLSLLLIIPILGSIILLLVTDNEKAKKIALGT